MVHAVPDADLIPADVESRIGFAEQLQAEILQIGVGQRCNSGHAGTAVIEQLFQLIHFTSVTDQDTSHHFPYQLIPLTARVASHVLKKCLAAHLICDLYLIPPSLIRTDFKSILPSQRFCFLDIAKNHPAADSQMCPQLSGGDITIQSVSQVLDNLKCFCIHNVFLSVAALPVSCNFIIII